MYWLKIFNDITKNVTFQSQRIHGGTVAVPSLTILNTETNDSGLYACYATNLVGTGQSQYTNLTVDGSKLFASRCFLIWINIKRLNTFSNLHLLETSSNTFVLNVTCIWVFFLCI